MISATSAQPKSGTLWNAYTINNWLVIKVHCVVFAMDFYDLLYINGW